MKRLLHDNGFGFCALYVTGLYGETESRPFVTFAAFPSLCWHPDELPPHRLSWVEKRLREWDKVWPEAQWSVQLAWPYQSEKWERVKTGKWIVTESSPRGIVD